jgi:hypothetical protein
VTDYAPLGVAMLTSQDRRQPQQDAEVATDADCAPPAPREHRRLSEVAREWLRRRDVEIF